MTGVRPLFRLTRFTLRHFVLNILFGLVVFVVTPLIIGFATQAFFDALAGGHTGTRAWAAIAVIVALQALDSVAGPIFGNPWSPLQQKAHVLLRRNLFDGILRGYGEHGLPVSSGEIVSRFRDDPVLIADTLDAACDLMGRTIFAVVAGIIMWQISPLIAIALFTPVLLCAWVTKFLGSRITSLRTASRAASGELTGFLGELLAGQLAIKVAGSANHAMARLESLGHHRRDAEVRDTVFGATRDAFSNNLGNMGMGLVLLLGAQGVHNGTISVGDLALLVVFLDALTWYPEEIGRVIGGLKQIDVSLKRMDAVVPGEPPGELAAPAPVYLGLSNPDLPAPPPRERLDKLEVRGLTYKYGLVRGPAGVCDTPLQDVGVANGITNISFSLERGSLTAITGRIGAGKTTLLQVLLGLLPRDAGDILWNGCAVDAPSEFFVPPQAAYTAQTPRLFSETVRENILLGMQADDPVFQGAVRLAVLEPDIEGMEQGLDTMVGPRGIRLSGGQMQRVAAARMFIRDAELIVFDDLSSALDAETEAELWQRLFARGRKQTYLVVTHRPAVLQRADQVLIMECGRLVTSTPRSH